MLNAGVHPVIPEKGSVGASGDLAPLAFIAAALTGHEDAEVFYRGKRMTARAGMKLAELDETFELQAKEALAILNGSTVSLALAVLAAHDAAVCIANADIALALTLEAMRAELGAFDERVHSARPHAGQVMTAENVRRLLAGSERCTEAARRVCLSDEVQVGPREHRVQDAYSLRCAPQVHGPVRDALEYINRILATEINSATDNPLVFSGEDGTLDAISCGNFHGQYIAQAMDLLALALTDLSSISERRASRFLDPTTSYGLPVNLVYKDPGLNSGFGIAQCTMAALVSENKTLCWPASVDSIPTKANQEDHVSNSTWCARKATSVVRNLEYVLAIECLMAAQAISLEESALASFKLGAGTSAAFAMLRRDVPALLQADRWIHKDIHATVELLRTGRLSAATDAALNS